jgi:hypothetical protein
MGKRMPRHLAMAMPLLLYQQLFLLDDNCFGLSNASRKARPVVDVPVPGGIEALIEKTETDRDVEKLTTI